MLKDSVPIWEKMALTIEEASAYSNIGINRIREICDSPDCPFVLFVGRKRLIKRKAFEDYVSRCNEI
jgi:excisionase family DNA binding protein